MFVPNVAHLISRTSTSPVDTTITHTYKSFGIRSIKVVETTVPGEIVPSSSAAITKFDFVADNYTSNIDIKPVNTALEYVMIMGCSGIASQEITSPTTTPENDTPFHHHFPPPILWFIGSILPLSKKLVV